MEEKDIEKFQEEAQVCALPLRRIKAEIGKVLAGQEKLIDRLLLALVADGHVLLEGVPGLAKTLAVKTLAQTLSGSFSRLQFTPDLLPADVIGTRIYNAETHEFSTRTGPIFANIVLADEINRAPAKVQSALLEAMQERQITIAGEGFKLPQPFLVMATQNPIEQEGTYPLPEAQLDRFMFKLKVGYPSRNDEVAIIERMARPTPKIEVEAVASLDDVLRAKTMLENVYLDEKIVQYILDLVIATRPGDRKELSGRQAGANLSELDGLLSFGASPRASIALAIAARTVALLAGRAYVLPQDVKDVAPDVLRHRLVLSYEAEAENIDADAVIDRLLEQLRTP
ncbi:MAG: AAA family ATPase [Victivallales bacterium]|jgi:MoxR-like ATPase|nr:AAA family ATPase [Victivallales bacterium]